MSADSKLGHAIVTGQPGDPAYLHHIRCRRHAFLADEPAAVGGGDAGPAPFDYLVSALGACTAITLRMSGERKGWDLGEIRVELQAHKDAQGNAGIDRQVTVGGALNAEQRDRLADVCERTPVTLVVKSGLPVRTQLGSTAAKKDSA